jgi:hypothetical protein
MFDFPLWFYPYFFIVCSAVFGSIAWFMFRDGPSALLDIFIYLFWSLLDRFKGNRRAEAEHSRLLAISFSDFVHSWKTPLKFGFGATALSFSLLAAVYLMYPVIVAHCWLDVCNTPHVELPR